ncbi:MAG: glycogen/starch synthase, partial [Candidatus Omnitrophica bacterium]|nr:glycogen/starch synthase [Candidatus Omnitrophota bacterium]
MNCPKGTFVLKFAAYTLEKAKFAISILNRAKEKGLPVSQIYSTKEGLGLIKIGEWYYFLEKYMEEGREIELEQMTYQQFAGLGKFMALLHNAWIDFIPEGEKYELLARDIVAAKQDFQDLLQDLLDELRKDGNISFSRSRMLFINNIEFILAQIESLEKDLSISIYKSLPQMIVHGDMKAANVIWHKKKDEVLLLFDWERSRQGQSRIEEFKNAISTSRKYRARQYSRANLIGLLKGYVLHSLIKFTKKELEALPYIVCQGSFLWDIARLFILWADEIDISDERYAMVLDSIETFHLAVEDFKGEWWINLQDKILGENVKRILKASSNKIGDLIEELSNLTDILDVELFIMHLLLNKTYLEQGIEISQKEREYIFVGVMEAVLKRSDVVLILEFLKQFYSEQREIVSQELLKRIDTIMTCGRAASSPLKFLDEYSKKGMLPGLKWGFYVFEIPESMMGGVADVAKGLPESVLRVQTRDGKSHSAYRVTPYYQGLERMVNKIPLSDLQEVAQLYIPDNGNMELVEVYKRVLACGITDYFFVNPIFTRPYDKSDQNNPDAALKEIRLFNIASAMLVLSGETDIDVMFMSDWQAGLLVPYLREAITEPFATLRNTVMIKRGRTLSTESLLNEFRGNNLFAKITPICWINNEAYRGQFEISDKRDFGLKTGLFSDNHYEWSRWITPERQNEMFMIAIKLGVESVSAAGGIIVTVSQTYAKEIMGEDLSPEENGSMLQGVFKRIGVRGVLNGTPNEWRYVNDIRQKREFKLSVQKKLGLEIDGSSKLFFMVSRLVSQKGVSLLVDGAREINELLYSNPQAQLVIGGPADIRWLKPLTELKSNLES